MSPPAWAYQVEYFEPPPHQEFICSICQCVFCDPVEGPCRHVYCSACIKRWISNHHNCPICRVHMWESVLQPTNRIIKNVISGLTLRCKNLENGCDTQLTLEASGAHICMFELEDCSNGCGVSLLRKDMEKHKENDCPCRRIECQQCGLIIQESVANHNCIRMLRQAVEEQEKIISNLKKEVSDLQNRLDKLSRPRLPSVASDSSLESLSSTEEEDFLNSSVSSFGSGSYQLQFASNIPRRISPSVNFDAHSENESPTSFHNVTLASIQETSDSDDDDEPTSTTRRAGEEPSEGNAEESSPRQSSKRPSETVEVSQKKQRGTQRQGDAGCSSWSETASNTNASRPSSVSNTEQVQSSGNNPPLRPSILSQRTLALINAEDSDPDWFPSSSHQDNDDDDNLNALFASSSSSSPSSSSSGSSGSHSPRNMNDTIDLNSSSLSYSEISALSPTNQTFDPFDHPASPSSSSSSDDGDQGGNNNSNNNDGGNSSSSSSDGILSLRSYHVDSDSSYEVEVPPTAFDLLKKFTQEESETDSDWTP